MPSPVSYTRVAEVDDSGSEYGSEFGDEENQCLKLEHELHEQNTPQWRAGWLPDSKLAQRISFGLICVMFVVGVIVVPSEQVLPSPTHTTPTILSTPSPVTHHTRVRVQVSVPHTAQPSSEYETSNDDSGDDDSDSSPEYEMSETKDSDSDANQDDNSEADTDQDQDQDQGENSETDNQKKERAIVPTIQPTAAPTLVDDYLANHNTFPEPGSSEDVAENEHDVELYHAWLTAQQSPDDCDAASTESFWHEYGIGSIVQTWKNTFIRSIARGRVMTSGFVNTYSNPEVCPSRQFEECILQPISTCKTKNPFKHKKFFTACFTKFPCERISKAAQLSQVRSLGWFHAQSLRYLLRPRESLTRLIEQVKTSLGLMDMRRVLSVHIRHGDLGAKHAGDKRAPINTFFYALMATSTAYWEKFDVIMVGSDDPAAFNIVKEQVTARIGSKQVRIIEFPTDIFEMLPKSGTEMASQFKNLHRNVKPGDDQVQEKSEDAALFAEMFIMAQSGGFLGSLNSNFGRTVYELAGGPESGKMLMDIEGRPYFGCEWTSKMPMGGGKRMYPFGH